MVTEKFAIWGPDEENTEQALRQQAHAHGVELVSCERYYDDSWLVSYNGTEENLRWLLATVFKADYSHEGWFADGETLREERPVT